MENSITSSVTREELNKFFEDVGIAIQMGPIDDDMPWVEAPRAVLEHFNRSNMAGVDSVGYFVYQGCKVYEEGKQEEARAKELASPEQRTQMPK